MGKAIDNAIEWYVGLECYTPQAKDARDVAISTMRKYQKIEQIMESDTYKGIFTYTDDTRLNHIREVLEDGSDD